MSATGTGAQPPLSDVMIAMDIVDTLRQDERLIDEEFHDEKRRKALIKRLRDIYQGQGIEVPERILEEGVKALEDSRFVYDPPKSGIAVSLARLYVWRHRWGRWVIGGATALALLWAGWQMFHVWPRVQQETALRQELTTALPNTLDGTLERLRGISGSPAVLAEAEALHKSGLLAAAAGDAPAARDAARRLDEMIIEVERTYQVRIVSRRGELSGLWRIPRVNPNTRNYYLVVEAVDGEGNVIERPILNEESGQREVVKKWAVRVPKDVFDMIEADKLDDGIIRNAVLGVKARGELEPRWSFDLPGGAITQW